MLAVTLPLFVGSLGLGVDVSHYLWVRGQLQNAADSAALAGAKSLNSTDAGRVNATTVSSTYATQHKVNGEPVTASELTRNETGKWTSWDGSFTGAGVSAAAANAVRVTVQRENVPSFFARVLSGDLTSQTIDATAIAVAGGAGSIPCGFPIALASCVVQTDSNNHVTCPTNLSFQNGLQSVGLTHPDGSSPVNGSNTASYIREALNPQTCNERVTVGGEITTLAMQNGNDLGKSSIDDINAATANGTDPVTITMPVVDLECGANGPTYNQRAGVVGFLRMRLVGARWTGNAPPSVEAACPGLGKKNLCITSDCSLITSAPGGGTIEVLEERSYLVN